MGVGTSAAAAMERIWTTSRSRSKVASMDDRKPVIRCRFTAAGEPYYEGVDTLACDTYKLPDVVQVTATGYRYFHPPDDERVTYDCEDWRPAGTVTLDEFLDRYAKG